MALDKLVDSTQLDADLTTVANAIRTKGGTSAQLAFPSGFASAIAAIPSGGGGSGKNAQIDSGLTRTNSTSYTDMGFEITVAKAGTYHVYWTGYRSSTSGTSGAQVYINGDAYDDVVTTFDGTYTNWQQGHLSSVTLAQGDKVTIRARARNTSYYMYIKDLCIFEA